MAIFRKTEKKTEKVIDKRVGTVSSVRQEKINTNVSSGAGESALVLLRPRITEKATDQSAKNAYIFEVNPGSNKKEIAQAIKEFYKVTPIAIHTMRIPAKNVFSRGRQGKTAGGKKAVVYLKAGDKIEVI